MSEKLNKFKEAVLKACKDYDGEIFPEYENGLMFMVFE